MINMFYIIVFLGIGLFHLLTLIMYEHLGFGLLLAAPNMVNLVLLIVGIEGYERYLRRKKRDEKEIKHLVQFGRSPEDIRSRLAPAKLNNRIIYEPLVYQFE